MRKGHSIRGCNEKSKLNCDVCGIEGDHHTFLHNDAYLNPPPKPEPKEEESKTGVRMATISTLIPPNKVLFHTANAYISNLDKRHKVKVVFDSCSDRSYITTEASKKINLEYHAEMLDIKGYSGYGDGIKPYLVMHTTLESITRPGTKRDVNLVSTNKICPPLAREAVPPEILDSKYLRGLDMAQDYSSPNLEEIDVLIGLDAYWSLVTGRIKRKKGSPIAVESILGWILQANPDTEIPVSQHTQATSLFMTTTERVESGERVSEMTNTKNSGDVFPPKEDEEEIVETINNKSTTQEKKIPKGSIEQGFQYRNQGQEEENTTGNGKGYVPGSCDISGKSSVGRCRIPTLPTMVDIVFKMLILIIVASLASHVITSGQAHPSESPCTTQMEFYPDHFRNNVIWVGNVSSDQILGTSAHDSLQIETCCDHSAVPGKEEILGGLVTDTWKFVLGYSPWWGDWRSLIQIADNTKQKLLNRLGSTGVEDISSVLGEAENQKNISVHGQSLIFRQCLNGGECCGFDAKSPQIKGNHTARCLLVVNYILDRESEHCTC